MSDVEEQGICWRCVLLALLPLLALIGLGWLLVDRYDAERVERENAVIALIEERDDLEATNNDLVAEHGRLSRALDDARAAAFSGGVGSVDELAAQAQALSPQELNILVARLGGAELGATAEGARDAISRLPATEQARLFETLPENAALRGWAEAQSPDALSIWAGAFPGARAAASEADRAISTAAFDAAQTAREEMAAELDQVRAERDAALTAAADAEAALAAAQSAGPVSVSLPRIGAVTLGEAPDAVAALIDDLELETAAATSERDAAQRAAATAEARMSALETQLQEMAERDGTVGDVQAELAQARSAAAAMKVDLDAAKEIERDLRLQLSERDLALTEAQAELRDARALADSRAKERDEVLQELRSGVGDDAASAATPSGAFATNKVVQLSASFAFGTGATKLSRQGEAAVDRIAEKLIAAIAADPDSEWVVLIKGHTDARPISNARFASNWELSAGRAASVARRLAEQGVPPERLWPVGRAEFAPLDRAETDEAHRVNRRIEFEIVELP